MTERWNTRKTLLQRAQDQDDADAWDEFVFYYHDYQLAEQQREQ